MFSRNIAWVLAIAIMIVLSVGETVLLMVLLGQGNEQPLGMVLGGIIGWFTPSIAKALTKKEPEADAA